MGRLRESTLRPTRYGSFSQTWGWDPFLKDRHPRVGAIEHVVNQAAVIRSSRLSHGAQATTDRTFVKKRSRHEWHSEIP